MKALIFVKLTYKLSIACLTFYVVDFLILSCRIDISRYYLQQYIKSNIVHRYSKPIKTRIKFTLFISDHQKIIFTNFTEPSSCLSLSH